jgi:hypothetical protein
MSPDSRRALLLKIIADARRVITHAEAALRTGDSTKHRRLCVWLYRLACEVAMIRGWRRPHIAPEIEAEAIQASEDQSRWWAATEAAKDLARWFAGRRR